MLHPSVVPHPFTTLRLNRRVARVLHGPLGVLLGVAMVMVASYTARADIDPLSGIDLVRIGAVGNAPWTGNGQVIDDAIGRGRVDHEYSIGRFEVTTAQWVEFFNAAYARPADQRLPFLQPPSFWGAVPTGPTFPGGLRWAVSTANRMRPVGDITWRQAAMYCNWLTNGKGTNPAAFLSGAYDVSTFGFNGNIFTDQLEHTPGASY